MRPLSTRSTFGFTASMMRAAIVKRMARKSKKGCCSMAGFMITKAPPHVAVTAISDQTAIRDLFTSQR
jgi:hypothetical protein